MTDKMTREEVLEAAAAARAKGERLNLHGADLSGLDLSHLNLPHADLSGADLSRTTLRGANLYRVNLRYANLAHANMYRANLRDADLRHTNLSGANLRYAILTHTDLYRADLPGVKLCGMFLDGLPSGRLVFVPTPEGWHLAIGCWSGTTDELREMIAKDTDWPEAEGEEVAARRPVLEAMADACDAFAATHPDVLADVKDAAEQWKEDR